MIHTFKTSFLSPVKRSETREFILFSSRFRDSVKFLGKPISCDLFPTIRVLAGSLNVFPELQQMFARTSKLL